MKLWNSFREIDESLFVSYLDNISFVFVSASYIEISLYYSRIAFIDVITVRINITNSF